MDFVSCATGDTCVGGLPDADGAVNLSVALKWLFGCGILCVVALYINCRVLYVRHTHGRARALFL